MPCGCTSQLVLHHPQITESTWKECSSTSQNSKHPLLGPTQLTPPGTVTPAPIPVVIERVAQPVFFGAAPSPLDILREISEWERNRHAYPQLSPARVFNPRVYESIQPVLDVRDLPPVFGRSRLSFSIALGVTENEDAPIADIIANLQLGNGIGTAVRPQTFLEVELLQITVLTSANTQMTELSVDGFQMLRAAQAINTQRDYVNMSGFESPGTVNNMRSGFLEVPLRKLIRHRFSNAGAGAETQTVDYYCKVKVSPNELLRLIQALP